jgi:hypothetical protein
MEKLTLGVNVSSEKGKLPKFFYVLGLVAINK